MLGRSLSFGSRGADVVTLQNFLIGQSLLAAGNNTGYFGKLTQSAIQKLQCQRGIVCSGSPSSTGYGAVGPRTRSAIAAACEPPRPLPTPLGGGAPQPPSSPTLPAGPLAVQSEIYVSLSGNDGNGGTLAAPVRTMERAQERVRELRSQTTADITVNLRGGTYYLSQTLVFAANDGGGVTQRITYRSYPGERAIISGGTPITNWTPIGGGIYRSSAPGLSFRQLYAPEQYARTERARYPDPANNGYFRVTEYRLADASCPASASAPSRGKKLLSLHLEPAAFTTPASVASSFAGAEAVILKSFDQSRIFADQVRFANDGTGDLFPTSASAIAEGCNHPWLQLLPTHMPGYRLYFENELTFLNRPGEWVLDGAVLYYMPHAQSELPDMVAPRLERLITVNGASYLSFSDLEFRHTTWNDPSTEGYIGGAAGFNGKCLSYFSDPCMVPGGIVIESGNNVSIKKSTIAQFGASGIVVKGGTSNITIAENVIEDMAGGGVIVPTFFPAYGVPTLSTDGLKVENNLIQGTGIDYDVPAIFVAHSLKSSISHNTIRFASYIGLHLGWFFGDQQEPIPPGSDSVVRSNDISDVMLTYHDGGGIYTLNGIKGLVIAGNYIHDFRHIKSPYYWTYAHMGLYFDLLTDGVRAIDNLIKNVSEGFYLQIESGGVATNNTVTGLHLVNVDEVIPTPYESAMRAEALKPQVNNVIQDDRIDQPQIASAAGMSSTVRALWSTDLAKTRDSFFPVRVTAIQQSPSVFATQPIEGQMITAGEILAIAWQNTNAPAGSEVSLFAVNAMTNSSTPIDLSTASGSYQWSVPATLAPANYFIHINLYKRRDPNTLYATAKSGTFTIRAVVSVGPASIEVSGPQTGTNVGQGKPLTIVWQSINPPAGSAVSLWLVHDQNGTLAPIDIVPTTGSYSWSIPVSAPIASGYYIQGNLYKFGDPNVVYSTTKSAAFTVTE